MGMKPKIIAKALRWMAGVFIIVICLGLVATAQTFDNHLQNGTLFTYLLLLCAFVFVPLALIFLCLGMAFLLDEMEDNP